MAPKRKPASEPSTPTAARVTRSAARAAVRSTRSRGSALANAAFSDPEPRRRKKSKADEAGPSSAPPAAGAPSSSSAAAAGKTVIIEHCLQCDAYKNTAAQVKSGLEEAVPGVNVLVNPKKPRDGRFEILQEGGDIFVSFQDLESPSVAMQAFDVGEVVSGIAQMIK
ncbi:selenium binding [Striga hermonthica]|uniref:Selenium binding n=1 Tax=Striga hermonthica TaxID=68872 RepID=A0A9N7NM13_STRHE|nr:selenium binding [Striga hermonthica]